LLCAVYQFNIDYLNAVKWEGSDRQHIGHTHGSSIWKLEIMILLIWRKFFILKYNKIGEKVNICNRATTNLSLRVKRPEHEADYSPQSNAEFKNEWSYTSMSLYAFMSCSLSKLLQDAFSLCEHALLCFNVDIYMKKVWNHLPPIQCARRPHIRKRQMNNSRERVSAASCGSHSVVSFPLRVSGWGRGL